MAEDAAGASQRRRRSATSSGRATDIPATPLLTPRSAKILFWTTSIVAGGVVASVVRDVFTTFGLNWKGLVWAVSHFVTDSAIKTFFGTLFTVSKTSTTAGGRSWAETTVAPTAPPTKRAALSVVLWLPLFSGVIISAAKIMFQANERDTFSIQRRREEHARAVERPVEDRASSHQAPPPKSADCPPLRRLDLMDQSSTASSTPRSMVNRNEGSPMVYNVPPIFSTPPPRPAGQPLGSPHSSATRELDSATLAIVTACSIVDLNAFLTAGCKYYVRNVVVPHGASGQRAPSTASTSRGDSHAASPTETPREGGASADMAWAHQGKLAHVTRRTLEFIGRFQRNVNLCEVSADASVPDFLAANAQRLHGVSDPLPVTVAVHRHAVAGATRLIDFVHPPSAIYCFSKLLGGSSSTDLCDSPIDPRRVSSPTVASPLYHSPSATDSLQSTDEFGSPKTVQAYQRTMQGFNEPRSPSRVQHDPTASSQAGDDVLAFCELHVYLSGEIQHNTLASAVNMVLYDRATKRKRQRMIV